MQTKWVLALCLACSTCVFAVTLIGSRLLQQSAPPRIAVVDLTDIVAKHQSEAVKLLSDSESSETTQKAAIARAAEFGKRVDAAVLEISRECGCVVMLKEAIVAGAPQDLTSVLVAKLSGN